MSALDQLAHDAGIRITTGDLAEHLRLLLNFPPYNQSSEIYKQVASQQGGVEYIESILKRCLAGQRYLLMAGFAGEVSAATVKSAVQYESRPDTRGAGQEDEVRHAAAGAVEPFRESAGVGVVFEVGWHPKGR